MMFAKRITPELCRKMRKKANLSQEEFGVLMGWSKRTVITRETVEFKLSLSEFEKFIMVTTTTPEERTERRKVLKDIGSLIDNMFSTNTDTKQEI